MSDVTEDRPCQERTCRRCSASSWSCQSPSVQRKQLELPVDVIRQHKGQPQVDRGVKVQVRPRQALPRPAACRAEGVLRGHGNRVPRAPQVLAAQQGVGQRSHRSWNSLRVRGGRAEFYCLLECLERSCTVYLSKLECTTLLLRVGRFPLYQVRRWSTV